jgi:DNA repair protein SbcC/Rad50
VEETIASLQKKIQTDSVALSAEFADLEKPAGNRDEAFQLDQRARQMQSQRDDVKNRIVTLSNQIKTLEEKLERAFAMRQKLEQHKGKMADARTLAQALHGDEFIAFIQHEAYRRLAGDGSVHLKTLSSGRYSFTVEKEDFQVIDHWNADEPRPVTTLSGGETFLASLALALALAEGLSGMSSGHTKFVLESLFLDEGFGTLDSETLETVVAGIEGLSANDRLIGIVSHIPDLAERMPARIQVRKSVGGSTIEIT